MYDHKEYARQMRTNAVIREGVVQVSQELWEQIATIIENSVEVVRCNVPPIPVLVEKGSQKGQTVAEYYADHLIQNGATIFPIKNGDTIYEADGEHGVIKHDVYEVCVVFKTTAIDDNGNEWDDYWTSDDIGNAYKTRNEAEAHLPQPPEEE